MATAFELDPILDDDRRAALLRLWTEVSNAGGAVGFVPGVSEDDVRPLAERSFAAVERGDAHLVVMCDDGAPIGFGFLERGEPPLFAHWATVKRLQVHPDLQGTGRGGQLLRAIEHAGRELGFEMLWLQVRGGTGTERFYERHGWTVVASLPRVIRVAPGDDRDQLWLLRELR